MILQRLTCDTSLLKVYYVKQAKATYLQAIQMYMALEEQRIASLSSKGVSEKKSLWHSSHGISK